MDKPTIEYNGQSFQLQESFESYDDYKNSSAPLALADQERAAEALISCPVPSSLASSQQLVGVLARTHFPGFAYGNTSGADPNDRAAFVGGRLEIPFRSSWRYFTYKRTDDGYVLIDDTVDESSERVFQVRMNGRTLEYLGLEGDLIFNRQIAGD
ncbi:hypothetical protein [Rhodopirellula sallentina]|uniref:hypothetical protein n=1 Tax=Rhodopirellula sallentina TaxID=1263869 RepID=UPI0005C7AB77|nr:hypothetical protein [Rhodopirellula sallentina]